MIEVRRDAERYRGGDPGAGIDSRHAFSFGAHYDPTNLRFGLLLACNEERLAPGAGFAEHPHRDTEIVTWVVEGELTHHDSAGHSAVVRPGQAQLLSAGAGVRHTERNEGTGPLTFVQMWLHPAAFGTPPRYAVRTAADLAPLGQPGAELLVLRSAAPLPAAPFLYVHCVRGRLRLAGHTLGPGDAARITAEAGLHAEPDGEAEYLALAMDGEPSYG
ncbi:pirin family protein [Actinacidiphila acididurans]|uniref:Pirin family protein n=1 Tax=Actinacidiphila acididurans TaxID=2784346 RepID=A0ABS2U4F8_9ACTN|nr:pirin family protein [Actinacidiphila acididurans]MBM9509621.1 pirin family protein [Actinacidiphila acididurans]